MVSSPPLIDSRPHSMRSKVDLPQPEGPTRTQNSPSLTSRFSPASTSCLPSYDFLRSLMLTLAILNVQNVRYTYAMRGSLERTGGQPAHQLARKQHVQQQDRDDRQRQRRQHRIPVGGVLPDKLLDAERDRFGAVAGHQDQGEPEIVPCRNHRKYRHRCNGGTEQRQNDLKEDLEFADAVAARGIFQFRRNLAD